jgi:hypothetical protein
LTPLQDQIAAGAEMWVLNSIVFLVPAVVITARLLFPRALTTAALRPNSVKSKIVLDSSR